jgi:hypothetical protein
VDIHTGSLLKCCGGLNRQPAAIPLSVLIVQSRVQTGLLLHIPAQAENLTASNRNGMASASDTSFEIQIFIYI